MTGEIRIIGGKFKGRKIKVCDIADLRPTPNRLRETLFNILQFEIKGADCLDAFAGTGALGLEALSRGAESVTFIEPHPKAYLQLKSTLEQLNTQRYQIRQEDCLVFLNQTTKQFDIIFLDPPFKKNLWENCIEIIYQKQLLNAEGLIYIESPEEIHLDALKWQFIKSKKLGDVHFAIFKIIAKS
jgi:16S rRNA (guanine966-N2)-methyltransferase